MSWRFRQSFKILPGLRLNLSKSGLSASIGGAPFTLNLGSRGAYATASIPGTGISFRQRLAPERSGRDAPPSSSVDDAPSPDALPFLPSLQSEQVQEIRSASTESLTSDGLAELKRLILTAYEEHHQISTDLAKAKQEETRTMSRFRSWDRGFLLKRLFKASFSARRAEAEIATARRSELEEQLQLTTIATQVELEPGLSEPFFRLRDDFTALTECAAIWDVKGQRNVDQFHERTLATRAIDREKVRFKLDRCDFINWEQEVPHMQNANGGDLFLYPGFLLYRASRTAFSLIDFHDVEVTAASVRFSEEEGVPSDSRVVGQTWAKCNKDGSRDRRFADNYEIPIARYGDLTLKSGTGLWEEFQFSNPDKLEGFARSWKAFVAAFGRKISVVVSAQPEINSLDATPNALEPGSPGGAAIHFECAECHQAIEVNADAAGQEFRCPTCGTALVVPGP